MATHTRTTFDVAAFFAAVDEKRQREGLSWRALCGQLGYQSTNLGTRLAAGRHVSAEQLCRLLLWLGRTDIREFVRGGP
jgi:hypothetical protein